MIKKVIEQNKKFTTQINDQQVEMEQLKKMIFKLRRSSPKGSPTKSCQKGNSESRELAFRTIDRTKLNQNQ